MGSSELFWIFAIVIIIITFNNLEIVCAIQTTITRVGIIGSGISGSTAALYLSELNNNHDDDHHHRYEISVFESNSVEGGRLSNLEMESAQNIEKSRKIEMGGHIIHTTSDKYLREIASRYNLTTFHPSNYNSITGLWNGNEFSFETSSNKIMSLLKMTYHFGPSIFSMLSLVKASAPKFNKIYENQKNNITYESPIELLKSMDLYDLTQISLGDYMHQNLKSVFFNASTVINEFVYGAATGAYNQGLNMNALVGMVSLIPAVGSKEDMWALGEGMYELARTANRHSKSQYFSNHKVTHIHHNQDNQKFIMNGITTNKDKNNNKKFSNEFDIIILAAPIEVCDIKFTQNNNNNNNNNNQEKLSMDIPPRKFISATITWIVGKINVKYFKLSNPSELPGLILPTNDGPNPNLFHALAMEEYNITTEIGLYKLTTLTKPDDYLLNTLFDKIISQKYTTWKAFPLYNPPEKFSKFEIFNNLYYVNTIENAVSYIELQAIAAKNIALLINNRILASFKNEQVKSDYDDSLTEQDLGGMKTEL